MLDFIVLLVASHLRIK